MRRTFVIALSVLLLSASTATADILHLHNGRTMEGKVIKTKRGMVTLKVQGGVLTIPASTIKRIERRRTPQEEYARRARHVDMSNVRQVEALATFASSRGLGEQAKHLRALAMGLKLERRVASIRNGARAQDYLDIYQWARSRGYSEEVQRWLLDEALEIDPEHSGSVSALRRLVESQEARVVARKARKRLADQEAKEAEAQAEAEHLEALRKQLADQKLESKKLRERLEALEKAQEDDDRGIRRRRRRHRRYGYVNPVLVVQQPVEDAPAADPTPPPPPPSHMPGRVR